MLELNATQLQLCLSLPTIFHTTTVFLYAVFFRNALFSRFRKSFMRVEKGSTPKIKRRYWFLDESMHRKTNWFRILSGIINIILRAKLKVWVIELFRVYLILPYIFGDDSLSISLLCVWGGRNTKRRNAHFWVTYWWMCYFWIVHFSNFSFHKPPNKK
jgi:hypothetical protein